MKPGTRRVLELLRERESLTPLEALYLGAGFRLGARIHELKAEGYRIEREMRDGYAVYRLVETAQLEAGL